MHSMDIIDRNQVEPEMPPEHPAPQEKAAPDLYAIALGALRGRYILAVVLGIIGMAVGGWQGWNHGSRVYRCEGLIHIFSTQLRPNEGINQQVAEAYMRQQQYAITSDTFIQAALRDPAWQETGRGDSPLTKADFAEKLKVERPAGTTEFLRIAYESGNPNVAAAAVRAVFSVFRVYHEKQVEEAQSVRLSVLDGPEKARNDRLKEIDEELAALKAQTTISISDLVIRAQRAARTEEDLALKLSAVRAQIANRALNPAGSATDQEPERNRITENEQLAAKYVEFRNALDLLSRLQGELNVALSNYGPDHATTRRARNALQVAQTAVADMRTTLLAREANEPSPSIAGAGNSASGGQALEAREKGLQKELDSAQDEVKRVNQALADAQDADRIKSLLMSEARQINDELKLQRAQREEIIKQAKLTNTLEANPPEVPIIPFKDNRMKFAGAGAMAGACVPIGLLILFGFLNRKYRYADEMSRDLGQQNGAALLGILPSIKPGNANLEQSADAAQSVHQIRVLLQMGRRQGAKVFLVSSASPGEGKTSLTVGLGLSFMASGARTLLIDCDLVGQSLTRGFGASGETGLHEAMAGGGIEKFVRQIRPGLSLLPVGHAHAADACAVSAQSLQPVLAAAREQYDVILVDSGPLLGSVEASVLAAQVDQVVMTISRGQQPLLMERTFAHLRTLGASVAGCVFNRAAPRDYMESAPGASLRSVSAGPLVPTAVRHQSRFGPLVESIMMYMPATGEG